MKIPLCGAIHSIWRKHLDLLGYLYGTWQSGKSSACLCANSFQSCPTLQGSGILAHQAPLSMGISRQEYWSGLPCPSPGDLPDPGIKPASLKCPALAGYLPQAPLGKSEIGLLLLLLSRFRSQSNENVTLLSSIQVPFVLSTSCGPGPM